MDRQPQLQFTNVVINNNEQRPLRILSLDGGGVRGYSMLLLLQEVMLKLFVEMEGRAPKRWEIPRPCDHFDLIAGTGTGGLIAIILGRLRLDVETALEIYVDMTRRVFETNKTVGGVPYRKTLYKASKLEEAIKEVVSMYDSPETTDPRKRVSEMGSPYLKSPGLWGWGARNGTPSVTRQKRSLTVSGGRVGAASPMPSVVGGGGGDSDQSWKPQIRNVFAGEEALWYDERPGKCKTFVTAVYHGSLPNSQPAILRTYDSAVESSPAASCTIWEAGRATCANYPAFKAIQIGQNLFHDEGHGRFNPSLLALDEAQNEWPGRKIGVFISIGSGKLPQPVPNPSSTEPTLQASRGGLRGSIIGATPLQKFVDAKENHIQKIGDCEQIHLDTTQAFRRRGLDETAYFRLNVDSSTKVGQAGMAEWMRLVDISNGTRTYLARTDVQRFNAQAAKRLARLWRLENNIGMVQMNCSQLNKSLPELPPPTRRNSPALLIHEEELQAQFQQHAQLNSQAIAPNIAAEFSQSRPIQAEPTPCSLLAVGPAPGSMGVNIIRRRVPPPQLELPSGSDSAAAPAYVQYLPSYEPTSARIVDVASGDAFEIFHGPSANNTAAEAGPEQPLCNTQAEAAGLGIVDSSQCEEMPVAATQSQASSIRQPSPQQQPRSQQNRNSQYIQAHLQLYQQQYQQQYQRYINPNTTVPAHHKYIPYQPRSAGNINASPTTPTASSSNSNNRPDTPATIPFSPALPTPPQSTSTTPVLNTHPEVPAAAEDPTMASLDRYLAQSLARQRREGDGEVSGDEDYDKPMPRGRIISIYGSAPGINRRFSVVSSVNSYSNASSDRYYDYEGSINQARDIRA